MTEARVKSSEASEGTSSSLLEQARSQDQAAWSRLIVLYTPLVWRWVVRAGGVKAADIEDICQEVFRAVHRKLPTFRGDRPGDTFRGWLRTIAHRKVIDHWKMQEKARPSGGSSAVARLHGLPDPAGENTPEVEEEREVSILYRRAVQVIRSEFEERSWQAFWRVTVDEALPAEVATALGMSRNAVYLACSRIRKRLRALLSDLGEDPPGGNSQ